MGESPHIAFAAMLGVSIMLTTIVYAIIAYPGVVVGGLLTVIGGLVVDGIIEEVLGSYRELVP